VTTCTTDPDASLVANARDQRAERACKRRAVFDICGEALDVKIMTGAIIVERIESIARTGAP
jgi:hypothetical protein